MYLILVSGSCLIGLLLGILIISMTNYAYRYKGHQQSGVVRFLVVCFVTFIGLCAIYFLNQLERDKHDIILAFSPLVFLFIGFIGWGLYLEKSGKARWKDNPNSTSKRTTDG